MFGPTDVALDKDNWAQKFVAKYCYPDVQQWPALDAYLGCLLVPIHVRIHRPDAMAANAYVWGYLAGAPEE